MKISPRIANLVRDIASAQGRSEEEILDEALAFYLRFYKSEDVADLGRSIRRTEKQVAKHRRYGQHDEFQALLDRMSSRFDLDEDEAMRIAVEEQNAFRRERSESERNER